MKIKVTATTPERIDKFLAIKLAIPRNQIQKQIKNQLVLVNDKAVTPHYALQLDDTISIKSEKTSTNKKFKLKIIFEDKDYLIINKPAGIAVHPTAENKDTSVTLVNLLLEYYPKIKKVGEDELRPGIVHRLDKDVSGILIIAKNQKFYKHIKQQFFDRKIHKHYLALVYGKIKADEGVINFPIIRSQENKTMMAALPPNSEEGREAITKFYVLNRYPQYTYLEVHPQTGRTHQIRVHLKAYSHSIVGDKKYKNKKITIKEELPQIFLHSAFIKFTNLAGELVTYKSSLPTVLKKFISNLK